MRVLILDINKMHLNGASTFALHMKAGLEMRGHDVTLIADTGRGKPLKSSEEHPSITWVKTKDLQEAVTSQQWDVLHLNDGQFKCDDYSFLDWLKPVGKTKSFMVHGRMNMRLLKLQNLFSVLKMDSIFMNDVGCINEFASYARMIKVVEAPFARSIMPPNPHAKEDVVACASRFFLGKCPEDAVEMFKKLKAQAPSYSIRFYGYDSFYAHMKKVEEVFRTPGVELLPPYKFADKPSVYGPARFMVDASEIAKLGTHRTQYTSLEAMHYGAIPVLKSQWFHEDVSSLGFGEGWGKLSRYDDFLDEIVGENYVHLDEHFEARLRTGVFEDCWARKI